MWISVDDGASSLKWEFVFYDGVRLLDIEFQFKAETFLYRVVALLDVSPELLEDGVRLHGDDLLPIRERSNIVLVVYCLSDDTYNFFYSYDELYDLTGRRLPVPTKAVQIIRDSQSVKSRLVII